MNTVIDKPADADHRLMKHATFSADPIQNEVFQPLVSRPVLQDATQTNDVQSLKDVMNSICDDCGKNSLQYVVRSDTGHDGE